MEFSVEVLKKIVVRSLDILKETIENEKDYDTIISIILLKLCNGSFNTGLLYHYNQMVVGYN